MRHPAIVRAIVLPSLLAAAVGLLGCADEEAIFGERPFFPDPPSGAAGFLGYDEQASKLTVCGNCHVGQQSEWELTAHADAWATLEGSGHAQTFCEACHTASANGNPASGDVGWTATGDARYHDVQCESCHGPGQTHVSNPDASQPLASLAAAPGATNGCAECHTGNHQPFVEEWSRSPHASVVTSAAGRAECQSCHRGQATLRAWGVKAEYVEKESAVHLPLTCGICHDPHDATNAGQLRFPVATTSIEEHLCARCHNRRTEPTATSHGLEPHAPQAALLVGDAGWFPPGAEIDRGEIRGTHGGDRNPRLCAQCHVNRFEVTDAETGEFVFSSTGHLFVAIPCVDESGIPTPGDCEITTTARSFQGCTAEGGCHDVQGAFSALTAGAGARIRDRANQLLDLLRQVDGNLGDAGGEIDDSNPTFTVAEGAFFNYNLANFGGGEPATIGSVAGSAVHNPFLTEALLVASIAQVEDTYGVSAGASIDWEAELRAILRRAER